MTVSTIIKGVITGASALAMAGVVLAQVSTGTPSSGSGIGVTPPPSTGVTTDTSRLTTDCNKVAADARSNQPPHDAMGCDRRPGVAAAGATTTNATVGSTTSNSTTANTTASDTTTANTMPDNGMAHRAQKLARADRG
jgi:hypothetical protein